MSPGLARNSGVMTLPSACSIRDRSGWVHDVRSSGSINPMLRAWSAACSRWISAEPGEHVGVGEVPVAAVEVVVSAHRPLRQPPFRFVGESGVDEVAEVTPHDRMGEFGIDAAGGSVHRQQGVVEDPHVHRVVTGPTARRLVRLPGQHRRVRTAPGSRQEPRGVRVR